MATFVRVHGVLDRLLASYAPDLERAAIVANTGSARKYTATLLLAVAAAWSIVVAILRPGLSMAALLFLLFAGATAIGVRIWIARRIAKRLADFNNQLEIVLRLIVSALRVGLGFRQAIAMVINDMPAPASVEFGRALAQTAIGVSIEDALDQLAARMPSTEMVMLVKAIRIQSKTGGNLANILLNLAEMIKQRRRIDRRIRSLTAESRSTKFVVTALPVFVTAFILAFEPDLRSGLIGTMLGRVFLGIAFALLAVGWVLFDYLGKIDV